MFGSDPHSLRQTLLEMARSANDAVLGQGIDPTAKLGEFIRSDARFKDFASDRLAAETMTRARMGTSQGLDLDDPVLKGGQERPGKARGSWSF